MAKAPSPADLERWLEKITSDKVPEALSALAKLLAWARGNPEATRVIPAFDGLAKTGGPKLKAAANAALVEIARMAAIRRGELERLHAFATSKKLAIAAKALAPGPEHVRHFDVAREHLQAGESRAVAKMLATLPAKAAIDAIAGVHDSAREVAASLIADAVREAVGHRDEVIRFAAIDALAICGVQRCDLSKHVPALIAALAHAGAIATAPKSTTYAARTIAESAQRALGHAVHWAKPADRVAARLREVVAKAPRDRARAAAWSLAWGSARCGDWDTIAELLGGAPHVVEETARALVPANKEQLVVSGALAAQIAALRTSGGALARTAAQIKVAGGKGGHVDPAVLAAGLRSDDPSEYREAVRLLRPVVKQAKAMEAIVPFLVDGLGNPREWGVLDLVRDSKLDLTRWAPLLAGMLLDPNFEHQRDRVRACLRRIDTRKRPWHALRELA
ncbi:MAG: hypothetical protein ABI867_14515 [Kofleriaceae bacterium]